MSAHFLSRCVALLAAALLAACARSQGPINATQAAPPRPLQGEFVTNGVRFQYCNYRERAPDGVAPRVAFWSSLSAGQPWVNQRHVPPAPGFTLIPLIMTGCPPTLEELQVAIEDAQPPAAGMARRLPPSGGAAVLDPDRLWADWTRLTSNRGRPWSMAAALSQLADQHATSLAALTERIEAARDARQDEQLKREPLSQREVERRAARALGFLDQIVMTARQRYGTRAPAMAVEDALRPFTYAAATLRRNGIEAQK